MRVAPSFDRTSLLVRFKGDQLLRNLSWLGLAEVVLRLVRIGTTIVVARALTPVDFGIAATAIAVFEVLRVFSKAGLMPAIVRAGRDELAAVSATVFRLALVAAGVASVALLLVAYAVAARTSQAQIVPMAAVLAIIFLLQPFGMVQEALLQRDGRMKMYGAIAAAQIICESIVAAVLAYAGMGAWALIVSKVASVPLWLMATRRLSPWVTPNVSTDRVPVRDVLKFSVPIIGSDLLAALRLNLDKAIVGGVLGIEALGIYYFAFNAGFGLSLTLTSALGTAAFTHLAQARQNGEDLRAAFDAALWKAIVPVCLVIGVQAAAALIYVPILFGTKWTFAAPYVAILCLAAATKPLFDGAAQMLRVAGLTIDEMAGASIFSLGALSALALGLQQGLFSGVVAFTTFAVVGQAAFAVWARRRVDREAQRP